MQKRPTTKKKEKAQMVETQANLLKSDLEKQEQRKIGSMPLVPVMIVQFPYRRTKRFSFWEGFFAPFWASFEAFGSPKRKSLQKTHTLEVFLANTSDHWEVQQDIGRSLRKAFVKYVGAIPVITNRAKISNGITNRDVSPTTE